MKIASVVTAALAAALLCGAAVPSPSLAQSAGGPWTTDTATVGELMGNPQANAVLLKNFPDIVKAPAQARDFTLAEIRQFAPEIYTREKLAAMDAELRAVPPRPMPVKVEIP
ncbi:MAG TPA: hypothetical protein VHM27_11465, partial [Rhizomicrobium sp.]|nr:hypothetical protein [Rhizomicrobium sp.]